MYPDPIRWPDGCPEDARLVLTATGAECGPAIDDGPLAPGECIGAGDFRAAYGWTAYACTPTLPDTASAPPGLDLTGLALVAVLLVTLTVDRIRNR